MTDLPDSEPLGVQDGLDLSYHSLLKDEKDALSKVLFPDTHIGKIVLLGKSRDLRPLTIKYARKLHAAVLPFAKQVQDLERDSVFDADVPLNEAMKSACDVIADFYEWSDVKKAVEAEDFTQAELQQLIVEQQALNGDNDFLLGPLRVIILILRGREIASMKLRNSSITQVSATDGSSALTT